MTPFERMILRRIPADYGWSDAGVVRIGAARDIAAYTIGDFRGKCLIFCHGNGETAVSERYWFEQLAAAGVSVVCPDYRGYGLSSGVLSETGCYEAAYAAYEFLTVEKQVRAEDVFLLGYSLGSAIAVWLVTSRKTGGLILQAPFLCGRDLRRVWEAKEGRVMPEDTVEESFPTASRLEAVSVPVLVIHGKSDEIIPFVQGKAVFSLLNTRHKRLVSVKRAGHCNFQYFLGERYVQMLVEFICGKLSFWNRIKTFFLNKQGEKNGKQ